MAPITSLYAAIAAILLVVLATNVIVQRGRQKVLIGDGGNPILLRAMRVHGNATEYLPIALVVMLCYELEHGAPLILHFSGLLLIVGRLIHAYGLLSTDQASPGRAIGIIATILSILVPSVALLFRVLLFSGALWMHQ
jgi:uncharacterized membrane protein YecN with MAPEG domain